MRRPLFAVGLSALAAAPALSADPVRPLVAPLVPNCPVVVPVVPCPPGSTVPGAMSGTPVYPGTPTTPGVTPGTYPGTMPGTPTTPGGTPTFPGTPSTPGGGTPSFPGGTPSPTPTAPSTPDVSLTPPSGTPSVAPTAPTDAGGGFARQSEGGSQAAASFAPTMFGDILGSRALTISYQSNALARFRLVGATFLRDGTEAVVVSPTARGGGTITFTDPTSGSQSTVNMLDVAGGANLDYAQPVSLPGTPDPVYAARAFELLLSRGAITPAQRVQLDRLTPQQQEQLLRSRGLLNGSVTRSTDGLAFPDVRVTRISGTIAGGDVVYDAALRSELLVALPGGSSLVGRVKMSEDNSPLPRDRFIFTYDNFDNVPFTTNGFTVNRYQFGLEKTFLDGRWSLEFRLPFAGTIASTNVQGFEVAHPELGNVRFALKRILAQNSVLALSSGLAVTLPTADDQTLISGLDGSLLYNYKNEQVTLEPFVAALFTPNDRLFSQLWGSVNFDASGGQLTWNRDVFGGTGSARVTDAPFLAVDYQLGYWLVKRDTGTLQGLAPFVELHWNYAIGEDGFTRNLNAGGAPGGVVIGSTAEHELNLSAGVTTRLWDNLNLSVGASAPLLQRPNRTFDAQFGVRASYLFGRTARARNPIYSIGTF